MTATQGGKSDLRWLHDVACRLRLDVERIVETAGTGELSVDLAMELLPAVSAIAHYGELLQSRDQRTSRSEPTSGTGAPAPARESRA